jgi:hypothetical protein
MAVDAVWDKLVSGCISLQTGKIQGIPLRPNDLLARYLQCLWAIRSTLFFAALKYQGNFGTVSGNFAAPTGNSNALFVLNSAIRPSFPLVLFLYLIEAIYKWSGTQFIWEE